MLPFHPPPKGAHPAPPLFPASFPPALRRTHCIWVPWIDAQQHNAGARGLGAAAYSPSTRRAAENESSAWRRRRQLCTELRHMLVSMVAHPGLVLQQEVLLAPGEHGLCAALSMEYIYRRQVGQACAAVVAILRHQDAGPRIRRLQQLYVNDFYQRAAFSMHAEAKLRLLPPAHPHARALRHRLDCSRRFSWNVLSHATGLALRGSPRGAITIADFALCWEASPAFSLNALGLAWPAGWPLPAMAGFIAHGRTLLRMQGRHKALHGDAKAGAQRPPAMQEWDAWHATVGSLLDTVARHNTCPFFLLSLMFNAGFQHDRWKRHAVVLDFSGADACIFDCNAGVIPIPMATGLHDGLSWLLGLWVVRQNVSKLTLHAPVGRHLA